MAKRKRPGLAVRRERGPYAAISKVENNSSEKSEATDNVEISEISNLQSPFLYVKPETIFFFIAGLAAIGMFTGALFGYAPKPDDKFTKFIRILTAFSISSLLCPGLFWFISEKFFKKTSLYWYPIGALVSAGLFRFLCFGNVFGEIHLGIMILFFNTHGLIAYYIFRNRRFMTFFMGITLLISVSAFTFLLPSDFRYTRLFVVPKIIAIYPFAALALASIVGAFMVMRNRMELLRNPVFIFVILTVIWGIINCFTSTMPAVTFFGSIIRQMGFITVLSFSIMAIAVILYIRKSPIKAMNLLYLVVIFGIILGLRAFYEVMDPQAKSLRPNGFAGNPDFFGNNLLFTAFFAWVVIFSVKKRIWAFIGILSFALSFYALVLSQTRGAWAGAGIASLFGLFLFRASSDLERKEVTLRFYISAAAVAVGFLFYHMFINSAIPETENSLSALKTLRDKAVGDSFFVAMVFSPLFFKAGLDSFEEKKEKIRYLSIMGAFVIAALILPPSRHLIVKQVKKAVKYEKLFDPQHGEARFKLWKDTLPMVNKHKLIGVGRETFRVNFLPFKTYELAIKDPGVNYRSSHNIYLDYIAMEGIGGFIIYMGLLFAALALAAMVLRRQNQKWKTIAYAVMLSLIAYMGHTLTIYDVLPTMAFVFFVVGIAGAMWKVDDDSGPDEVSDVDLRPWSLKYAGAASMFGLFSLVGLIITLPFVYSHHVADYLNTKNLKNQAEIKQFLGTLNDLRKKETEFENIEQRLTLYEAGNRHPALIKAFAGFLRISPGEFQKNPASYVQKLRNSLPILKNNFANQKSNYIASSMDKVSQKVDEMFRLAEKIMTDGPAMGYHSYIAGHGMQNLIQLPSAARKNKTVEQILEFVVNASEKGVKRNTNPESAWSRLSSSYYSAGAHEQSKGNHKQAWIYYKKALHAIEKSISFDRWYYDTHRIRAIFMIEKFCNAQEADRELQIVSKIVMGSRNSKAKSNLYSFLPLYLKLANIWTEMAQSETNPQKRTEYVKKAQESVSMLAEIELDRRKAMSIKNPGDLNLRNSISLMDAIIKQMRSEVAPADVSVISRALANFQGGKSPTVYSSCMAKRRLMEPNQ